MWGGCPALSDWLAHPHSFNMALREWNTGQCAAITPTSWQATLRSVLQSRVLPQLRQVAVRPGGGPGAPNWQQFRTRVETAKRLPIAYVLPVDDNAQTRQNARVDPRTGNAASRWVFETSRLILTEVFGRHIVLFNLLGVNFRHTCVRCILHATNHVGLEGLALVGKFFDALRVCLRDVRQPLIVARLAS